MIHRALFGSVERFIAVLIEHFAGAFPLWLAPVQARVLTVSEKAEAYAREVVARLQAEGLRVEADLAADKLGAKIRRARSRRSPTWSWSAKRTWRRAWFRHAPGRGSSCRPCRSTTFARQLAAEAKIPNVGGIRTGPAGITMS